MADYQPVICGICPYGCAVLVASQNGKILDVKADDRSPHGHLCPRGKAAPQIVHSNERLKTPLIRNGPKGEAAFRQATWDEALALITEKLTACKEKFGPNSLASYSGGGSLEDSLVDFGDVIFGHLGSVNDMNSGSICFVSSRVLAPLTTLGISARHIRPDLIHSDVIFVWGTNPFTDSGKGILGDIREAQKRGAKLIVIDPRKNETAAIADVWLPVTPGTDGALILAMLKILIEENRYDPEFAAQYALGLPELRQYLTNFKIEDLLTFCGVSISALHQLMDLFCSSTAVSVTFYTGLEYQPSAVQCVRSIYILWGLGGKLDVEGGLLLEGGPFEPVEEYPFPPESLPVGAAEYPLFTALCGKGQFVEFPKAVLQHDPYPIKALLILGASPILSYPDAELWEKVYRALDFLVVIDRFMPDEGRFADVVLPATTYYENFSYCYYKNGLRLRQRVIPPVGEARNDLYILHSIAEGLGHGQAIPKDDQELLELAFRNNPDQLQALLEQPYGIEKPKKEPEYKKYASGRLRKDGEVGFPSQSGKLEIASPLLEKYGYDPLPVYQHPYTEARVKYPYFLTTGARSLYRYNSFGANIAELRNNDRQVTLDISPEDAEKLGLKEGEQAKISTPWGSMTLPVRFCDMASQTVHVTNGGGSYFQPKGWKAKNVNQLCNLYVRDTISGFVACKALQCSIEKI